MPRFRYEVLGAPGERLQGQLDAESRISAVQELGRRGLHILTVDEVDPETIRFRRRLSLKQIAHMTRQLASLIGAGLPLLRALQTLEGQARDAILRETLLDLRNRVKDGVKLSDALEAHESSFGRMYISMVRAGEAGGMLDEVLRRMGAHLHRELDLRSRVRAALAYPSLMVMVGLVTIYVLLSFVIPKITVLFAEGSQVLPTPTLILIAISSFFADYWLVVALLFVAAILAAKAMLKTERGALGFDRWLLRLPYAGELVKQIGASRFCRVLGTLLGNGVPMLQALDVTANTIGNRAMAENVNAIGRQIRQGETLSREIRKIPNFPPLLGDIIQVGEHSGELEKSLLELADEYDAEIERTVRTLVSLLEPLLIIMIGGAVGFIVLALLLPIFDLNEVIQ